MRTTALATLSMLALAWPLEPAAEGRTPRLVILVRHAEAGGEPPADPSLTDAGRVRARALAAALEHTGLDAIIVTPFARTRMTAEPVAQMRGITPMVVEVAGGMDQHVAAVVEAVHGRPADGAVLVVGHSNTIPAIVRALGGPPLADLCHTEFATLFVLTLPPDGPPRLLRASYGPADPPGAEMCEP